MARARKICSHVDGSGTCSNIAEPGTNRCRAHRRPERWSTHDRKLPSNWSSSIVPRILRRDPVCTECGLSPSVEVDHIGDRDDHSDGNLCGLCKSCHHTKTQRQAADARWGRA